MSAVRRPVVHRGSYFTCTQIALKMRMMLLCPVITDGIATPADKRLFAAVHWASSANGKVVTDCEAPPPGLAFTTALKMINDHIPSPHGAVFGHHLRREVVVDRVEPAGP
jgi:hypothetical protein